MNSRIDSGRFMKKSLRDNAYPVNALVTVDNNAPTTVLATLTHNDL